MPPCYIDRPVGTGDYLFMFFYDPAWIGTARGFSLYPPETMVIWCPGQRQHYGNDNGYRHSWMHCDGRVLACMLKTNRLPTNEAFAISPTLVERMLLNIYEELTLPWPADEKIVTAMLDLWGRQMWRYLRQAKQPSVVPERFQQIRLYIESHFHEKITLADMAHRCHCSIPHFCNEFKKYFGSSAIEFITRLRMYQAEYLLRDENLSVTEIAARVGYNDIYYFSKRFRKSFGLSPRNLRKRIYSNKE